MLCYFTHGFWSTTYLPTQQWGEHIVIDKTVIELRMHCCEEVVQRNKVDSTTVLAGVQCGPVTTVGSVYHGLKKVFGVQKPQYDLLLAWYAMRGQDGCSQVAEGLWIDGQHMLSDYIFEKNTSSWNLIS